MTLTMLDNDDEVTRAVSAGRPDLRPAMVGGLRPVIRATRQLVALATRDRLTAAHDERRYVIRRPVDRFARVL